MASDQGLKQPVSNTVPQPRRSPPRAKAIASIASSSSTPSYLNPTQSTTNKAVVAVKPTPALEPSLRHTYRARQRSVISNASISSPSLAPNERHQQGFRSPSASITTSTTPESYTQQPAQVQSLPQSMSDPDDAPLDNEHTSLDVDYPTRGHSMGTEAAFLEWYPVLVPNPGSETSTRIFWSILFNWFTVGVLHFVTSIDLEERKKYTPFVYGDSIDSLTCGGAVKTSALIPVNHNKPDWVLSYIARNRSGFLMDRICMIIKSKPRMNWNTAMAQIVVYTAKALLMDGCAMGLVVAGTEYRFLWWDTEERRLYMVVPVRGWDHGNSLPLGRILQEFTESVGGEEWDVQHPVPSQRELARRNLYSILKHLDEQTRSMVADQQAGRNRFTMTLRPVLSGAKFVEITEIWGNLPRSSAPLTNGANISPTIHEAPEPETGGSSRGRDQEANGGTADQGANGGTAGNDYLNDDDYLDESDAEAQYRAKWKSLGNMSDANKEACLFYDEFQREHVIPFRREKRIDAWAQGIIGDVPGLVRSTPDAPITSDSEN
ncbi:hypothetical protein FFLO_03199 [Filobasidium floriforme]|uniref:Uncharacterized protein n=1 Tax=Filobasidium floriforme TaxID=5210 RepID=A0A8K0NNF7_9TREE|nr:hypothetical protein FFLO_03199 [Filobasidium floriforme]